jgi:hypothetical protein
MRGAGPTVFSQVINGVGMDAILKELVGTWQRAVATAAA